MGLEFKAIFANIVYLSDLQFRIGQNETMKLLMNVSFLEVVILVLVSSVAYGGQVVDVKAQKVLLDISDQPEVKEGQKLFLINIEGKKKAVVEIKKIKSGKAVADLIKGQAEAGMTTAEVKSSKKEKDIASSFKKLLSAQGSLGVLTGINSNTVKVKLSPSENVNLSGPSFSLKAFFQQKVDGNISVRLGAGYESLVAEGRLASASCLGSSNCHINVSYLGFDAMIQYYLGKGEWKPWVGGGLGFLIAVDKSSNTLNESKISTNQSILFASGVDYHLGPKNFIPIEVVYGIFPANTTVSASQFMIRAGYAKRF